MIYLQASFFFIFVLKQKRSKKFKALKSKAKFHSYRLNDFKLAKAQTRKSFLTAQSMKFFTLFPSMPREYYQTKRVESSMARMLSVSVIRALQIIRNLLISKCQKHLKI
ncbi:hypothetical protein AVL50_29800 [Flammeovirga sp. SJP92]|nr:hypothetical protein AVL50_29800 [Flammeovirga sp. SJP92]